MAENRQVGWASEVSAHETKLKQKGMKNTEPSAVESHPKGGSVDSETTRSEVARSHSIGGRVA